MCPFRILGGFHVLGVANFETPSCFAYIGFVARFTTVLVNALSLHAVQLGLVFTTKHILQSLACRHMDVASSLVERTLKLVGDSPWYERNLRVGSELNSIVLFFVVVVVVVAAVVAAAAMFVVVVEGEYGEKVFRSLFISFFLRFVLISYFFKSFVASKSQKVNESVPSDWNS